MTDDMIRRLLAAGLNKQQAYSTTAETLVNLFMPEDGKMLIREARLQVEEMKRTVNALKTEFMDLKEKINQVSNTIQSVVEAQEKYGEIKEDDARNAVALYGALLAMNERVGASGVDSVRNAGYILYAYLGGQAKREISYSYESEE